MKRPIRLIRRPGKKRKNKLKELLSLISRLPENEYIKIGVESEEGERFLSACHFVVPPEDGWPNRAAYFRHPPDNWDAKVVDFPWKYDDSVLYGVCTEIDQYEEFIDWLIRDLKRRELER